MRSHVAMPPATSARNPSTTMTAIAHFGKSESEALPWILPPGSPGAPEGDEDADRVEVDVPKKEPDLEGPTTTTVAVV
jgi:hypothetical protein